MSWTWNGVVFNFQSFFSYLFSQFNLISVFKETSPLCSGNWMEFSFMKDLKLCQISQWGSVCGRTLHAAFLPCMEPAPMGPACFSPSCWLHWVQWDLEAFVSWEKPFPAQKSELYNYKKSKIRPLKYSLNNYIITTRYNGHHFNEIWGKSFSLFFFCQTNSSEASLGKLNACMSQLPDNYWYGFSFSSSRQGNKIHFCVGISQGSVWKHASILEQ